VASLEFRSHVDALVTQQMMNGSHTLFTKEGALQKRPVSTKAEDGAEENELWNPVTPIVEFAIVADPEHKESMGVVKVSTSRGFGARKSKEKRSEVKSLRKERVMKKRARITEGDAVGDDGAGDGVVENEVELDDDGAREQMSESGGSEMEHADSIEDSIQSKEGGEGRENVEAEPVGTSFASTLKRFSNLF
jgi:hypothetical protein